MRAEGPRVARCGVCGTTSGFLYTCSRCSEQYCIEHIDRDAHDCVTPTAEGDQSTDLWRVALGMVFFLAVIGSFGGFVWTFGSAESLVGLEDGDAGTATTISPPPGVQVLQPVNDARSAAVVSSVGYYAPLADLAADQSWPSGGDSDSPDPVAVGEVRCGSIATLVYNGSNHAESSGPLAETAVETWQNRDGDRETLLGDGWDLGGAAVVETEDRTEIRLLLCDSTGNGTAAS